MQSRFQAFVDVITADRVFSSKDFVIGGTKSRAAAAREVVQSIQTRGKLVTGVGSAMVLSLTLREIPFISNVAFARP